MFGLDSAPLFNTKDYLIKRPSHVWGYIGDWTWTCQWCGPNSGFYGAYMLSGQALTIQVTKEQIRRLLSYVSEVVKQRTKSSMTEQAS